MGICESKSQTNQVSQAKKRGEQGVDASFKRPVVTKTETFNPQKQSHVIENKGDINAEYDIVFNPILGEGAFGKVLLATHVASGLKRAIKVINKGMTTKEGLDKIIKEVRKIEKSEFSSRKNSNFLQKLLKN